MSKGPLKAPYLTIILGVIPLKKTRSKFTQLSDNIGAITNKLSVNYPNPEWENQLDASTIDSRYWGFFLRKSNWPFDLKILFQGNPSLMEGMVPTMLFNPVDQKTWDEITSIYPKNAKRWPPQNTSQLQYKGKFHKISNFIDSGESIQQMADEIFDYVVEMVEKLRKDVDIIAQIIND